MSNKNGEFIKMPICRLKTKNLNKNFCYKRNKHDTNEQERHIYLWKIKGKQSPLEQLISWCNTLFWRKFFHWMHYLFCWQLIDWTHLEMWHFALLAGQESVLQIKENYEKLWTQLLTFNIDSKICKDHCIEAITSSCHFQLRVFMSCISNFSRGCLPIRNRRE